MFGRSAKALREGMEGTIDDEEDEKPVAKAEKKAAKASESEGVEPGDE